MQRWWIALTLAALACEPAPEPKISPAEQFRRAALAAAEKERAEARERAELAAMRAKICTEERRAAWDGELRPLFTQAESVGGGLAVEIFVTGEWSEIPFPAKEGISEWISLCFTDEPQQLVRVSYRDSNSGAEVGRWRRFSGYESGE